MPLPPATFVFAADALTGGAPTNLASGAGTDAAATGALTGTISVGAANDGAGVSRPAFVLGGGHIDPAVTNAHVALVGRGFSFFARVRCAAGAQQRFTSTFEASGKQTLIVEATAASKIQVSVDDDLAATQPIAATTTDAVPAVVAGEEFDLAVVFDGGSSVLVWANGAFLPLTYGFRAVRAMAWRAGLSGDGPRAFATDSGTLPVTGHARLVALGIGRQWTADEFAALAARADEVAPLVTSGGAARYTPPTSGLALSAPVLWRDFAAGGAPASERGFWYHEVPLSELGLDPIGGATHLALDSTEHGGNDSYDGTYAALTDGAGTVVADLNRILAPPAGYRGPEGPSLVLRDDDPAGKPLYLYAHAQRAASH
ncbi:MAG TPA: hypothetical protein VD838_16370, partial [Anaeromyxobacteraceae bacterium]|nr:hypothetical protein [Anaeromyxobacteraceae bacterium]